VAAAALESGAAIINDISGLTYRRGRMAKIAAEYKAAVVIMHMQGRPQTMQRHPAYCDVVTDVADYLQRRVAFALECGVKRDRIIIDPGIGFGKTAEHNWTLLRQLRELKVLGYPILAGVSRKGFIGRATATAVPVERLAGSLAGAMGACCNGASIVRVHDVRETAQALAVFREFVRTEWN
jgi:dihydropteroate synthase